MSKINPIACIILIVTLISCKTYTIPVDSFRKQFSPSVAPSSRPVTTVSPWGTHYTYHTLNIDSIQVIDKKGKVSWLKQSPSLEMRITHSGGKRTVFYFDLTRFNGDTLEGSVSRLVPAWKKKISISTVTKIEIQNGGKNYHYKN